MRQFEFVSGKGGVRGSDVHGEGFFGAGRAARTQQGVDFTARAEEEPSQSGNLVRIIRRIGIPTSKRL